MTNASRPATPRALWCALAALAALLIFVPTAAAERDPIASGSTDLHMKKGFVRKLANTGVAVSGIQGGTVTGNKIGLAVGAGMLDPTNVQGHLEPRGGFKFSRGNRGVPIFGLSVNTVRGAVFANVAKARMQLATFAAPAMAREGFGANFRAGQLVITEKAARRISNRLGLSGTQRIEPNRVLSNIFSSAQPRTVTVLPGGDATLAPSQVALNKLEAKGVQLPAGISPIAPATKQKSTALQLPISGGTLAPDGSSGRLTTGGGLEITKKASPISPTVKLTNVVLDFGARTATAELELLPNPPLPGAVGRSAIATVTLPSGAVSADPTTRQITIKGAEARLQAAAASTLNSVFNQPAPVPPPSSDFVVGDPLGTFSLVAQAQ